MLDHLAMQRNSRAPGLSVRHPQGSMFIGCGLCDMWKSLELSTISTIDQGAYNTSPTVQYTSLSLLNGYLGIFIAIRQSLLSG
jgi:hypothetical protein